MSSPARLTEAEFTESPDSEPSFPKYQLRRGRDTYSVERTGRDHWTGWRQEGGNSHRVAVTRLCASEKEAMQQVIAHITGEAKEEAGDMTTSGKRRELRRRVGLELIDDNPWQPRQSMEPEALRELADSIRVMGLLQVPLGRRVDGGRVQLAFGHRRVAASRLLHQEGQGAPDIDLDIAELTDEQMAVMALTENERRTQLNQLEVARAQQRAVDETALSMEALSKELGIARPTLSNRLRVLELPDFVLERVESGEMGLTVAREFLALQGSDHAHVEDMQAVIRQITATYDWNYQAPADWSRRNVRMLISRRVSHNEDGYRPLGPPSGRGESGGSRVASFDVDEFIAAMRDGKGKGDTHLHTVPADDGKYKYETSRLWTCKVKEWRRWQTRATREANKAAAEAEKSGGSVSGDGAARPTLLEETLRGDPVWKLIVSGRETGKHGPHPPVTDQERELLGTRAEMVKLDYGNYRGVFHRRLERAGKDAHPNVWNREGGDLPPYFPDVPECQNCVIGAAYAYGPMFQKPMLHCFNREHFEEKAAAGEAEYRSKLEEYRRGIDRQDERMAQRFGRDLEALDGGALRALAVSLLAGIGRFEWLHPFGRAYEEGWSFEAAVTARARELLGREFAEATEGRPVYLEGRQMEALDGVDPGGLRELVAHLMAHQLRISGQERGRFPGNGGKRGRRRIPLMPARPWCHYCRRYADKNYCGRKVCSTRNC